MILQNAERGLNDVSKWMWEERMETGRDLAPGGL